MSLSECGAPHPDELCLFLLMDFVIGYSGHLFHGICEKCAISCFDC